MENILKFKHPFFSHSLEVGCTPKGVVGISFHRGEFSSDKSSQGHGVAMKIIRELSSYLKGVKRSFNNIPIDWSCLEGTKFQKQVWKEIKKIPYGQVRTYGQLARSIKNPNACRSVGTACGKNPLLLVIPCHRVVGSESLGGFSGGGLSVKRKLHSLEKIHF